jgi:MoCo/4Fe-4S cofactor protein with predicted Tat translocation signal
MITLPELAIVSENNGEDSHRAWRSIEEFSETPEFAEFIRREYPSQESVLIDPVSRRNFLKLMAASLILAGSDLSGCAYKPKEEIVPSVIPSKTESSGKPKFFATAMTIAGSAMGLLVRSDDGRPTKVEGNPKHPASLGATDVFAEASILGLYDPDRSQTVLRNGKISSWGNFVTEFRAALEVQKEKKGAGLRILTETIVSPTIGDQLKKILAEYPEAKWHQYERVPSDNKRAGAELAFGRYVNTIYKFDKADRILSLDADFLDFASGKLRYIRDFASRRKSELMSRFYMIESTPTLTGGQADHKLQTRPSHMQDLAISFANVLGINIEPEPSYLTEQEKNWVAAAAKDISDHQGSSVIIAGNEQPPWMHHLEHTLNFKLGNIGKTVFYTEPIEMNPVIQSNSLMDLTSTISSGSVEMLLILGGNPVYSVPVDSSFADLLSKINFSIHLSLYEDETSQQCSWHIPQTHYLEEWSDTRAFDGTASIVQPLIAPLYGGKSIHDILTLFSHDQGKSGYELVRDYWKSHHSNSDFEDFWRKSLHEGVIESTTFLPLIIQNPDPLLAFSTQRSALLSFEIIFRNDASVFDGRFANNGWLQELPNPLTKITWDNAALISPNSAKQLGIESHFGWHGGDYITDIIGIELNGRKIHAPVWILPGQPDNCITLPLGYGRKNSGRTGNGIGFDAGKIMSFAWNATGAHIIKIEGEYILAVTQHHHTMDRSAGVPPASQTAGGTPVQQSLYPPVKYEGYAWGMSIDLNSCIGCNACITSCQAENNIPIVGKEQVAKSREMHWLRVDRYYTGSPENPEETAFQPVPCMHCENAPCEVVCPVEATVHSAEGLNDMVYNRCVGTRYCSNNCPYKVRRFNFLLYQDWTSPALELMRNPEVSVRSRGVMEKCTYCVQRIQHAKIVSEEEGRPVRDGEIKTACQSACPAEAIIFGNINDPQSRVSQLKREERNYSLLEDLNTKPRTTYLSRLRNPNPMMK